MPRAFQNHDRCYPAYFFIPALLTAFLVLTPFPLHSAPVPQAEEPLLSWDLPDGRKLEIFAGEFTTFVDGDHRVLLTYDEVHILFHDTHIRGDRVVVWFDYTEGVPLFRTVKDEPFEYGFLIPNPLKRGASRGQAYSTWTGDMLELYAEGHVKISREGETFFCDQLYTNFAENRGVMLSGEYYGTMDISGRRHPIHFKAAAIRQICSELYTMEDASLSTCTFGIPHYDLKVKRAELRGSTREGLLSLSGASLARRGLGLPLPDTSFQVGRHWYFPVKSVSVGSSSKFGPHLLITLGDDIDQLGSRVHSLFGIGGPFKGDAFMNIDLYDERGLGLGTTLEYESPGRYKGYTTGYFINDSADEDSGDIPIEENKRGRIRSQNRINVWKEALLDLELSYITDRQFLDEYFEEELKTDKEQETYLYLHEAEDNHAYSLLSSWRLNDFDTQTEYLPQGIWDLSSIPITGGSEEPFLGFIESHGLRYTHKTELSNVRNRPDNELDIRSERLFRADYRSLFEAPLRVRPFTITPFYENRLSYFERTLGNSNSVGRVVESYGVRMGFMTHTQSDFTSETLNIHGIRNILEPSVVYRDSYAISRERDELIFFDEVETPTRGNEVSLFLRQRLQTKGEGDSGLPHDLYDGIFRLPFYPDRRLSRDGHRMGDLDFDIMLKPLFKPELLQKFSLNEEGRYSLNDGRLETLDSTLLVNPHPDWRLRIWHGWVRDTYSYVGTAARRFLTEKWEGELGLRYNIEQSRWSDRTLSFRRRAHQWIFEIQFAYDKGDDNKSVSLAITPLAIYGTRYRGSIYDPMLGE
jgi:hypothetical protein